MFCVVNAPSINKNDNNRFKGAGIDGELELTKDVSKNIHSVGIHCGTNSERKDWNIDKYVSVAAFKTGSAKLSLKTKIIY